MKKNFSRYLLTAVAVLAAIGLSLLLYVRYTHRPWTRDAQVRANVVGIAPRVAGPVVRVAVRDNQAVTKGDVLFEIDPATFQAAVAAAEARVEEAGIGVTKASQEVARQRDLYRQNVNDVRDLENAEDGVAAAEAERAASAAELQTAQLNLSYTKVVAPVNGYITNLTTSPGTYVSEGAELLALVDRDSFWVAAYFKETQLGQVRLGGQAKIIFLGHESSPVVGEIESVGWGVFREDGSKAENLLPKVSQTVDWVRLPQRFPARVKLTGQPPVPLRIGQTVSVVVAGD